jgi:hypothetical protein
MAGEIHVYFHNSGGDDRSGINATSPKNKGMEEKIKDATRTSAGKNQEESDNSLLTSILIDSARKIAIDSINNIGDLSGNYQNQHGTHGHLPDKGPQPTFIGCGPHFKKGVRIEEGDILNHAPTLASLLGVTLYDSVGTAVKEILK